jgi:hypothetical protein
MNIRRRTESADFLYSVRKLRWTLLKKLYYPALFQVRLDYILSANPRANQHLVDELHSFPFFLSLLCK